MKSLPAETLELPTHDDWHWGQRQGLVLRSYTPWGKNGRKTCRWCHGQTEAPRRCWCSEECVGKYERVYSWGAMRSLVMRRDKRTCQRCGTTTPPPPAPRTRRGYGREDPWDVDHIIRVVDGGTDDPENLRLLCIPCHTEVGHEQRSATAKAIHVPTGGEVLQLELL